jgi:hypothetical protein
MRPKPQPPPPPSITPLNRCMHVTHRCARTIKSPHAAACFRVLLGEREICYEVRGDRAPSALAQASPVYALASAHLFA